ncbi:hypothetical protein POTOM_056790 [Populus tomentosa]|uniref:Pentatricopeptide repeat-containing protein n=1 Tax=Populus tomentosa TaxID=118781 RepID=A0A8X7XVB4_POPTO|nr:hypothetical protein POTOM_056790 [Populus tomentosa]
MYRSHGCVADACELFEKMPVKDVSAWDSILDAYASTDHQMDEALNVFNSMLLKDLSSFNIMILCQWEEAKKWGEMRKADTLLKLLDSAYD